MKTILATLARPIAKRTYLLVLAVLLLNVFDAYASLYIIRLDSRELNPVNLWLMGLGTDYFLCGKIFIAALLILALAVRAKKVPSAVHALWIVFVIYAANAAYQIAIIGYWLAIR